MQPPAPDSLTLLLRITRTAPLIPLQQLLHLPDLGRPNRIHDRRPRRRHAEQPTHGRPKGVCEQTEQLIAAGGFVGAASGADGDGGEDEEDVEEVEAAGVVPEDDFEAVEDGRAEAGVALLEFGGEGAGGFEGGGVAAKTAGEEENGDEGDGVV